MDIKTLSALELGRKIAGREISAPEATQAMLDRIAATDTTIKAYLTVAPEQALAQATAVQQRLDQGEQLMPLAGVAALAVGAVVSFLISQIRPTFADTVSLRDLTGLPVLGAVSMIVDPERIRKQRRDKLALLAAVVGLVMLFVAMTVWLVLSRMGK